MINSLFDRKTLKKLDDLASKQAKLDQKKNNLVKKTMEKIDSETLYDVLNIANIYGHPNEQKMSEEIKKRYLSAEDLEFNDLVNLDSLYKSNYEKFQKKVDDNE